MPPLRCVTFNLWGEQGPVEERLRLVEEQLGALAPDVVGLQEVREVPGRIENQAARLARRLKMNHVFVPTVPWGGGNEGLALLSRTPILEHRSVELPHATTDERRVLLSARVQWGEATLWVHTTHLNYRLSHGKQREDQVLALERAVAACRPEEPQILMGDFNARPEADEIRWLSGLTTLEGRRVFYQDAWALIHPLEPGWTWAAKNPYTDRLAFLQPDRRLDYIFVTPRRRDGRGTIFDCRIALDIPGHDGVLPSDHYGLCAEVQVERSPGGGA